MEQEVNEGDMKQRREQIDNAEKKKNEEIANSQLVRYYRTHLFKLYFE